MSPRNPLTDEDEREVKRILDDAGLDRALDQLAGRASAAEPPPAPRAPGEIRIEEPFTISARPESERDEPAGGFVARGVRTPLPDRSAAPTSPAAAPDEQRAEDRAIASLAGGSAAPDAARERSLAGDFEDIDPQPPSTAAAAPVSPTFRMPPVDMHAIEGERRPGNIDLHSRPIVNNPDGSISTVRSASFGMDEGEVLLPTVSDDGRDLSDDDAITEYRRTGRHLGVYDSPEDATRAGERIHAQQAREYGSRGAPAGPVAPSLAPDDAAAEDAAIASLAGREPPPSAKGKPALRPAGEGEMIPQEGDLADARLRDAIRNPFVALARALQVGAGGRPGARGPTEEQTLGARRDRMMSEKQGELQRISRERAQGDARAREDREMSLREREATSRTALAERGAERQEAAQRAAEGLTNERAATERAERDAAIARRTAGSEESRAAARDFTRWSATLPRELQELVIEGYGQSSPEDGSRRLVLDDMSAEQIEAARESIMEAGRLRGLGRRPRAGTGGRPIPPEDRATLEAEGAAAGLTPAVMRTMTPAQISAEILRRTRDAPEEDGRFLLPGVRGANEVGEVEARDFRRDFTQAASTYGSLQTIRDVAGRYGSGATIDPQAAAELAAPIAEMRALYAAIQNTGVINPTEAPAIEAAIPNPTSLRQMTFGELNNRIRSFEERILRNVRAGLRGRGVDQEGVERAIRLLRGATQERFTDGETATPRPPASDMVVMERPDGTQTQVHRSQVQRAANERGYREVP